MVTKGAYKLKLYAQLKEWNALIDLLAAKVENAGADVKLKYAQELDEIRAKQREAAQKIQELEDASADAWENVRATTDKAWYKLGTGLAQAIANLK